MKKIKLSEININANKLNGKPSDYFDHTLFGIGKAGAEITDCNSNIETGFYTLLSGSLNTPEGKSGVLLNIRRTDQIRFQLFFIAREWGLYYRILISSGWLAWKPFVF